MRKAIPQSWLVGMYIPVLYWCFCIDAGAERRGGGRVKRIASVSEKIRKPPLAEAQTAAGKQRCTFRWTRLSVLWKTASPRKISLKSGNRLRSYDQKRFSIWRPSAILNIRNLEFASRDFHHHAILPPCAKLHWIGQLAAQLWQKKRF